MLGKIVNPYEYATLGMRENTYLLAFVLTLAVLGTGLAHRHIVRLLSVRPAFARAFDVSLAAVCAPLVFVFLRPISQFIYFQF